MPRRIDCYRTFDGKIFQEYDKASEYEENLAKEIKSCLDNLNNLCKNSECNKCIFYNYKCCVPSCDLKSGLFEWNKK
jgi:hypothetical protein